MDWNSILSLLISTLPEIFASVAVIYGAWKGVVLANNKIRKEIRAIEVDAGNNRIEDMKSLRSDMMSYISVLRKDIANITLQFVKCESDKRKLWDRIRDLEDNLSTCKSVGCKLHVDDES